MVRAGAAHGDGAHDHQLVEVGHVRKLGHRGLRVIAAPEDFHQVHLGHAPRGVLGVVIALGVDHERLQQAVDLRRDLGAQQIQFVPFDEGGDVVVRMKPSPGRDEA